MIEIIRISKVVFEVIETNDPDYPYYRRCGSSYWENLMGDSWEIVYNVVHLEDAYRAFLEGKGAQ